MSRNLRTTIGVVLSLLLLGWALRDVSVSEVVHRIRTADLLLLTLAVVVSLGGLWIRALRWGVLLTPIAPRLPFRPRLAATFIGFAVNNLLPARMGEFARALSLSKLTTVGAAPAFAALIVERLFDSIILFVLLFAAMAAPGFPEDVVIAGVEVGAAALRVTVVILIAILGLFAAVLRPRTAGRVVHFGARLLTARLREPFVGAMRAFAAGLDVLRNPRLLVVSLFLAAVQWLFLAFSFVLGFLAFAIEDVPFAAAVFLQSLISLAVAIPSTPGFFGPFEAAAREGLSLWNVPGEQAISFAIGFHIAGFLPVTLIGVYYIWRLNLSWSDVRESEAAVENRASVDGEGADPWPAEG